MPAGNFGHCLNRDGSHKTVLQPMHSIILNIVGAANTNKLRTHSVCHKLPCVSNPASLARSLSGNNRPAPATRVYGMHLPNGLDMHGDGNVVDHVLQKPPAILLVTKMTQDASAGSPTTRQSVALTLTRVQAARSYACQLVAVHQHTQFTFMTVIKYCVYERDAAAMGCLALVHSDFSPRRHMLTPTALGCGLAVSCAELTQGACLALCSSSRYSRE